MNGTGSGSACSIDPDDWIGSVSVVNSDWSGASYTLDAGGGVISPLDSKGLGAINNQDLTVGAGGEVAIGVVASANNNVALGIEGAAGNGCICQIVGRLDGGA